MAQHIALDKADFVLQSLSVFTLFTGTGMVVLSCKPFLLSVLLSYNPSIVAQCKRSRRGISQLYHENCNK